MPTNTDADKEYGQDPEILLNDGSNAKEEPGSRNRQFIAGLTANIIGIMAGAMLGWSSPSLAHLHAADTPIPITNEEDSWISSLLTLAAGISPFAAGFAADKFGRKMSLLFGAIPVIIHYICLAVADAVWILYLGRILAGLSVGWIFTILPMYTGEVAEKAYKGALGTILQFSISVGLVFDYSIGPYVEFKWLSVASLVFPVLFLIGFSFIPESPQYLLQKKQDAKAKKALQWLRGKSAEGVATELKILQTEIEEAAQQTGGIKDIFSTKANIKSVGLCVGLLILQQFSGINVVLFNAESIFTKAGGSITPAVATIIVGVVMIIASIPTPMLVERLGRKVLLIASAIGMGIALTVLGVCFYLDEQKQDTSNIAVLPIISVVVFLISYCPGFGSIPWAVTGEMYPPNIKAIGSTLTASAAWFAGFIVTRFFNDMVEAMGNSGAFWFFAACCAVGVLFVFFLLPETKGKTVAEIQLELS